MAMTRNIGSNIFTGTVGDAVENVSVIGTWGDMFVPIVCIQDGPRMGRRFAIDWESGAILKEITYKK